MVVLGYFSLGIIAYWSVLPDLSGRVSPVSDFVQSAWFIGWVPHALANGLNPFFSNAMYAPVGVNLASNTASPFLGLLTVPLAPFLSPLARANLLMVFAMPLSATAAFVVLRKWHIWGPAAALGGLMYGFSPYMVGQGDGHPELMFVPLPPLIALTVASILQGRGSWRRLGIQLGVLVTIQYLISPEILATTMLLTVVALVCVAIGNWSAVPRMANAAAGPLLIAIGLTAALLAYPIWMLVAGPQHFSGATWPLLNPYHTDLVRFVDPGAAQRVSLGMRSSWAGILAGNVVEDGGYIGIPMLIVTGLFAWRSRRTRRMQLAVVLFIVSGLLSLGPYLAIHGRVTGIPLPFIVLAHLPLFNDVLASRMAFETDAFLAAIIAFGLDDVRRTGRHSEPADRGGWWTQRRRAILASGVVLGLLVATQLPQWPYPTQRAGVLPARLSKAIPPGDPMAITYPYAKGLVTQPLLWQSEAGFRFRMIGGYAKNAAGGGRAIPNPMKPPDLQDFLISDLRRPIDRKLLVSTKIALSRYDIQLVIVNRRNPESGPVMKLFEEVLGPPNLSARRISMWVSRHGALKGNVPPGAK